MSDRYLYHYHILGIRPGANWDELRQAYKSLVNLWHPDRFQQDGRRRKLAEEKTKEITRSYQILAEYYKRHGVLPAVSEEPATPAVSPNSPAQAEETAADPDIGVSEPAVTAEPPAARRFGLRPVMMIAAAAGVLYFFMQIASQDPAGSPAPGGEPQANPQPAAALTEPPPAQDTGSQAPKTEKFFTVGASLGEVYAIQGVPTKTENDVWYYGQSKVYFANGKVVRWEENPDNPLHASASPQDEKLRLQFFGQGSSKNEVLAVQGAPDRDAGNVWDYGASRVYFENDHVKSWDESPFNPLKVRH
jgi:curved DNA-binding protein CbpA